MANKLRFHHGDIVRSARGNQRGTVLSSKLRQNNFGDFAVEEVRVAREGGYGVWTYNADELIMVADSADTWRSEKRAQALRILLKGAINLKECIDNYDPDNCRFCRVIRFVQLRLG